ncbi:dihydroxyacetone kinase subunit DhaL [Agromyces marinus]|uniref:Dihydroxyacetone kinase subunit L n=1 Tax=Agromyces marinus TaxID=1389020 RepID=A0ABM8GXF5_9MICO|nr:dihydroxyacetone kinase subunit DhaL [Agromyces marinus]UIP58574.1 PEP-dependent dihydroxyacetone kinase, ADP-binding subunit DhaL [Agromyces marinus]BDZ53147.1 dihydroxyacetone kinase subunit L [Agromyces marinus]
MGLDITWAVDWVRRGAETLAEHRVELITLDREIGDGDHGENMDRGFQAVLPKLDDLPAGSAPSDVLKLVATTLISTVGGAAGPLYGTAFLKGSMAVAGESSLDAAGVAAMLEAARDGIVSRGKAESGDKTMVDAWTPAVDAARSAADGGASAAETLRAAADAAATGAAATEPLVARKGRASYLGERSAGHRDPGAQSTVYLLEAAAVAAANGTSA